MSYRLTTWEVRCEVPAGNPAYKEVDCKITIPESGVTYSEYFAERTFIIQDVVVKSSGDVPIDGLLKIVKNRERLMGTMGAPLSQMLATNPAKPVAFQPMIGFRRGEILTIKLIPIAPNTATSTQTDVAYLKVLLFPA
jgi:hypothetical protein